MHRLGISEHVIAKNLLGELEDDRVTGLAVDSINHLLSFALDKQREAIKRDLQAVIESLDSQEAIA